MVATLRILRIDALRRVPTPPPPSSPRTTQPAWDGASARWWKWGARLGRVVGRSTGAVTVGYRFRCFDRKVATIPAISDGRSRSTSVSMPFGMPFQ